MGFTKNGDLQDNSNPSNSVNRYQSPTPCVPCENAAHVDVPPEAGGDAPRPLPRPTLVAIAAVILGVLHRWDSWQEELHGENHDFAVKHS